LVISYPFFSHPDTIITCESTGDFKWISMGLRLRDGASIEDVIICYQVSNSQSFVSQVRLAEMSTPNQATVIHDDGTALQSTVPTCYTSNVGGKVPAPGNTVILQLRLDFKNTADEIRLGAVGIKIQPPVIVPSYPRASLPHTGNGGSLARVADDVHGLWMDSGSQWFDLSGELINVKEFGAKGDGVSDDTTAVQSAIQAAVVRGGGTVLLPPGTFRITASVSVPANVTLSVASTGQINIASGVTLLISGPLCAPPQRIFSGPGTVVFKSGLTPRVYPQWWGAYSDGTHPTETAAAIRAAIGSLFTISFQPLPESTDALGSSQVLEFLAGYYVINDEIAVVSAFANAITGSGAIIKQTDSTKNILKFSDAYMIRVSGLRFIGGAIQLALSNANLDTTVLQIDHCEFQVATKYAITATPTSPADHLSALLTIENCKFYTPAAVLQTYCDWTSFDRSWVTVGVPLTPPNTAVFSNMSGALHINNLVGVPGFGATSNGCRWIDNHGSVMVDNTRFGGEDAGLPIIYNYAGPAAGFPFLGASVEIRNSAVAVGHIGDPNAAVLNLQTDLPQVFIYEGNTGPADNPLIVNGGSLDLDTYLSSFSDNQFRYVAEPNQANLSPPAVPEPLRPLFNFLDNEKLATSAPTAGVWKPGQRLGNISPTLFGPTGFVLCQLPNNTTQWVDYGKSSPFPIGPRQAQMVLPGNIAKYSFAIPPTTSAFVAIVTFSGNPNFMGSAHYRTVASFLIGLTAGFDGTQGVDVLSSAPLFQPATPEVNSTSLGGLFFGTGNSGSNQRPATTGGSFTVLWTNASRIDEAFVTIEVLHAS
jgi:hypothetical protein